MFREAVNWHTNQAPHVKSSSQRRLLCVAMTLTRVNQFGWPLCFCFFQVNGTLSSHWQHSKTRYLIVCLVDLFIFVLAEWQHALRSCQGQSVGLWLWSFVYLPFSLVAFFSGDHHKKLLPLKTTMETGLRESMQVFFWLVGGIFRNFQHLHWDCCYWRFLTWCNYHAMN